MQVSLRLRSGIAVASQFLHAGNVSLRLRSGIAVASQCLHANNAGLARLRSGIAASSRWQCKPRYGFAVASQWLRSVFTPTMQASLDFSVASQCLHAGNASLASASLRHRSGFVVSLRQQCWPRSASQWHRDAIAMQNRSPGSNAARRHCI